MQEGDLQINIPLLFAIRIGYFVESDQFPASLTGDKRDLIKALRK